MYLNKVFGNGCCDRVQQKKGGIDGELVGWGGLAARKTLSQQINEGNTKLADFLTQNDDHDYGDIGDSLNMFCFDNQI